MKVMGIACSLIMMSLSMGGCGGTESTHAAREIDSHLTMLADDRVVDTQAGAVDADATEMLPPMLMGNSNGWIRIDTPALVDANARVVLQAMSMALASAGEAINTLSADDAPYQYLASNGDIVEIMNDTWLSVMDSQGTLAVGLSHWIMSPTDPRHYSGDPLGADELLSPPFVFGEYLVLANFDSPDQISAHPALTTIALSIGLPDASRHGDSSTEDVRSRVIPVDVATPCGTQTMQVAFEPVAGHARQWHASLHFSGHEIPLSLQGLGLAATAPAGGVVLTFDRLGQLDIPHDFVLLTTGNMASLLRSTVCQDAAPDEWRLSMVLQKQDVLLLGERYPFNAVFSDTPYRELALIEILINTHTVTALYQDGTSLNIGYGSLKSQRFEQKEFVFTFASLDLGILGDGYYVLSPEGGGGAKKYTRLGDFYLNAEGVVVNAGGDIVQAYPVDEHGNVASTEMHRLIPLQVSQLEAPAQATSSVKLGVMLPAGVTPTDVVLFDPRQISTYSASTTVNLFDAQGYSHLAVLYFIDDDRAENQWAMYCMIDGRRVRFDDGAGHPLDYITLSVGDGPVTRIHSTFNTFRETAWTQTLSFAITAEFDPDRERPFSVTAIEQDGFGGGLYPTLYVDYSGLVYANVGNDQAKPLGKLALARFANPQGLRAVGDSAWLASDASGAAQLGEPATAGVGFIYPGVLEFPRVP